MTQRQNATPVLIGIGLFISALLAMFVFSMAAKFDEVTKEKDTELAACNAAPSVECLIEAGLKLAMLAEQFTLPDTNVQALAEMGRKQDARALEMRILRIQGVDRAKARSRAQNRIKEIVPKLRGSAKEGLTQEQLNEMSQAALNARDFTGLITAAHTWYLHNDY
jgi:hypothetical protein